MSQKYKLKPTYRISKIELFNSEIENINCAKNGPNKALKKCSKIILITKHRVFITYKKTESSTISLFL